ncbi:uncharacterized protein LOC135199601 [Macrobrachium nipponense]|uniref:uncharacterized protein LOC135199601 n=1 Tax=Macrobrachium nipponense TaxID=159736 RepID=UPI0030C8A087
MNPEIKVLNGKIKELEASIGVETDDSKDQKIEPTPPQGFTASRKDLENIENFFNRFPNTTVKNKNEVEVGKVKKEEKEAIRRFISLDENSGPSKISSMEPNRDTSAKSLLPSSKSHRLAFDESKIKKMFEKACEITEKTQATSSSNTSGNSSRFVEKKVTSTFDNRKESPSNTKRSSDSIENSIDKRLKEIRLQSSKTPSKIDMRRISPIRLDKGHSLSDSLERQSKKRKSIADQGFVDPSLASVKVKDTESPVASNISKSLLERLGSVPAKEKSSPITLNDSGNGESDGYHPDVTSPREVVSRERKSFWCQHCSRSFIAVQAYISHLESPRHLKVAMSKQSERKGIHNYKDGDVPKDQDWIEDNAAWYKGSSNKQVQSAVKPDASSEELCIAVVGIDTFCTKKQLGHFHSRCFAHAKCLLRNKDNHIRYSPDSCSVCLEYLQHCHSSLKCCERIFRIFKTFKKRCGLNFDWEEKSLKDWFFDNYRKIQDANDSANSSVVSFEDFKAQMQLRSESSEEVANVLGGHTMEGPPSNMAAKPEESGNEPSLSELVSSKQLLLKKNNESGESSKAIHESSAAAEKKASSVKPKCLDLHRDLDKSQTTSSNNIQNSSREDYLKHESFCEFLQKYSNLSRDMSKTNVHSYHIVFDKDDPFITEVCKKSIRLEFNPPSDLLQGIRAQFTCVNEGSEQIMTFLHRELFTVSDLSFQFGKTTGYCSPERLEKFNRTLNLAKSHFNIYAALVAVMSTVRQYNESNSDRQKQDVSKFHHCLVESLAYLAKEILNPLKFYINMALYDKHKLRQSGFNLQVDNTTVCTLVRYNIFSRSLFDEPALKTTYLSSPYLSKFVNTEKFEGSKEVLGDVSVQSVN